MTCSRCAMAPVAALSGAGGAMRGPRSRSTARAITRFWLMRSGERTMESTTATSSPLDEEREQRNAELTADRNHDGRAHCLERRIDEQARRERGDHGLRKEHAREQRGDEDELSPEQPHIEQHADRDEEKAEE